MAISKLAISTLSCCLHCNLLAFHSAAVFPLSLSPPRTASLISLMCARLVCIQIELISPAHHTITLRQSKQLIFHLNRSTQRAFSRLPLPLFPSISLPPHTQSVNCALEISISEFNAHKTHDVYRCKGREVCGWEI